MRKEGQEKGNHIFGGGSLSSICQLETADDRDWDSFTNWDTKKRVCSFEGNAGISFRLSSRGSSESHFALNVEGSFLDSFGSIFRGTFERLLFLGAPRHDADTVEQLQIPPGGSAYDETWTVYA